MKNEVKNGYCETPGMEIMEKWSKNAIFPFRHTAEKDENDSF